MADRITLRPPVVSHLQLQMSWRPLKTNSAYPQGDGRCHARGATPLRPLTLMRIKQKTADDGGKIVSQPHSFAGTALQQTLSDTLSLDNGGVSGPDYSDPSRSFRRATPRSIQCRRWYRARSMMPDSL
jgi:hypothetical protein